MVTPLENEFSPKNIERRLYQKWEQGNHFSPRSEGEPFVIVLPPPNVTGSLHIGHALNHILQDIIIRYKRMCHRRTLWLPGTDHAGIATQMVVERLLSKEGLTRQMLGRDAFLEKVWHWKEKFWQRITYQQKRLGDSLDWKRERFTMDDGLSSAVLETFVSLYKEGLIYRDKRLVNWDPKFETAISDLEVVQKQEKGFMWYIRYPVIGVSQTSVTVATTRPETLFGDSGIAVNPKDDRYRRLIGKNCLHPLTDRNIPIVADVYADPDQGTGAVKITPAHDFNDFSVGKRCNLAYINTMTPRATMNDVCPEKYRGLDRLSCRALVIEDLQQKGHLAKREPCLHTVPYGDRSDVPIEPYLTDQWYVNATVLAKPVIEAVRAGRVKFVPENWEKIFLSWLENIQPWCISRQLWWGHRIPVWYANDGTVFVEKTEDLALEAAQKHFGKKVPLRRDEDVLDTWFSSGLWGFATLGWHSDSQDSVAKSSQDFQDFYPTNILVTAFDILFFWVARMMMFGWHFTKKCPFSTVVVHALVLDEAGAKMSKSKGNVIDPLHLMDEYGSDALRFTLSGLATPGKDLRFSLARMHSSRNFLTKVWNVAKLCQLYHAYASKDFSPTTNTIVINRWIVAETIETTVKVQDALEAYRFSECTSIIYHFFRGTFCDWYVECIKPILWEYGNHKRQDAVTLETRQTVGWVLQKTLKLMHPFIPFITERLWEVFGDNQTLLIDAAWFKEANHITKKDWKLYAQAQREVYWIIDLIKSVRSVRAQVGLTPSSFVALHFKGISKQHFSLTQDHGTIIKRLAKVSAMDEGARQGANSGQFLLGEATVFVSSVQDINVKAEKKRLQKTLWKAEKDVEKFSIKISNKEYLRRAPSTIIEKDKGRLAVAKEKAARTSEALKRLEKS